MPQSDCKVIFQPWSHDVQWE